MESLGSYPDHPHSGDGETIHVSRKRSRSPIPTPRGPSHVRACSPARQLRDTRGSDIQTLPFGEGERDWAWERNRERERALLREREKERQELARELVFERELELEMERELEKERDRKREKERERERWVAHDLNGVHPSRKGELPGRHPSVGLVLTPFPQR